MCIFAEPVLHVGDTRIFARRSDGWQHLAYEMTYRTASENAMVIPVPADARLPVTERFEFVDLSGNPTFFDDLDAALGPVTIFHSLSGDDEPLPVFAVGSFEASFVPDIESFSRLDDRLDVPSAVFERVPAYRDWAFAVCRLRPGAVKIHPFALRFRTARSTLHIPTLHCHDGEVPRTATFDHEIYVQGTAVPHAAFAETWTHAEPSHVAGNVDVTATGGLVDPTAHLFRSTVRGERRNEDFVVEDSDMPIALATELGLVRSGWTEER